ncbi:MAG: hypothetical protein ACO3B9_06430, partial [Burkholderiaceae bacterium]
MKAKGQPMLPVINHAAKSASLGELLKPLPIRSANRMPITMVQLVARMVSGRLILASPYPTSNHGLIRLSLSTKTP